MMRKPFTGIRIVDIKGRKYYVGYQKDIPTSRIQVSKLNKDFAKALYKLNGTFYENRIHLINPLTKVDEHSVLRNLSKSSALKDTRRLQPPPKMTERPYTDKDGVVRQKKMYQYEVVGIINGTAIHARSSFYGINNTDSYKMRAEAWNNFYALLDGYRSGKRHVGRRKGAIVTGDSHDGYEFFKTLEDKDIQLKEGWIYYR